MEVRRSSLSSFGQLHSRTHRRTPKANAVALAIHSLTKRRNDMKTDSTGTTL